MNPTAILMNEHRVIEQVLDCLERMANACEADGRLEVQPARDAVEFFREFADRCHHAKEENQLFPVMESRGFPAEAGPIGVMRLEHDRGRALIRHMDDAIPGAAAGEKEARKTWVFNARSYVELLREHIRKEDHCLFPMAEQAMTDADRHTLRERFEQVERDEIGPDVHERYVRLAEDLAKRFGVPGSGESVACADMGTSRREKAPARS